MSFAQVTADTVAYILPVVLEDSAGDPLSGVAAGNVTASYKREGAGGIAIPVVSASEGAWVSGGWSASTGMASNDYELHIPNAALAAGVKWVEIFISAVGAKPIRYYIELGPYDVQLPDNFQLLSVDTSGRVDVSLIEGVDATNQIVASLLSTITNFVDAMWDEPQANHTVSGSVGESVGSINTANQISAQVWNDKQPVDINPDQSAVTIGSVSNRVLSNVDQIDGNAQAAANLSRSALKLIVGNASSVSATQMVANINVTGDLQPATIVWDNGSRTTITSYSINNGVGTFTYPTLNAVPSNNAAFVIV